MVLAVAFTATRGGLSLIAGMIPTLTGNNYPEDIAWRHSSEHCNPFVCVSLDLISFSNWNIPSKIRLGTGKEGGEIYYSKTQSEIKYIRASPVYYADRSLKAARGFARPPASPALLYIQTDEKDAWLLTLYYKIN